MIQSHRLSAAYLGVLCVVMPLAESRAESHEKPAARPSGVKFFVSPRGNDAWSGRSATRGKKDGPFATVARAWLFVRDRIAMMVAATSRNATRPITLRPRG